MKADKAERRRGDAAKAHPYGGPVQIDASAI
jgi:hypothetical protein